MSIKGVIQLIVCLQSYYIIEYPYQGLFAFNISIFQEKFKTKSRAIPYQIISQKQSKEKNSRLIVQSKIEDETATSTIGLAKYSDETIELGDWFQFRLEIEGYPKLESDDIYLQIDFRFNHTKVQEPEQEGELIQTALYKLNDIQNGIFSYCEGQFDTPYASRLNFYVLGFLTSFKFAKYQPLAGKQLSSSEKRRLKVHNIEQLMKNSESQSPEQDWNNIFYLNYVKKLRISQYLIADKFNTFRKNKEKVEISVDKSFKAKYNYDQITEKEFKEYLDRYFPDSLNITLILKELNVIREQNFNYLETVVATWMNHLIALEQMKKDYMLFQREKYGERVFKSVIQGEEEIVSKRQQSYRENKQIAKQIRSKNIVLNSYSIEDIRYEQTKQEQEIIFYEQTIPFSSLQQRKQSLKISQEQVQILSKGCAIQYSEKHMLVVLCHGFQGSSYDMQLIKRWIQRQIPDAYYLISRCNEDSTEGDIKEMGKKLATEIQNYISNYMEEYQQQNVIINLVGHSMGGIVARAVLPFLEKYKHQLGFFCSLSSPHLGYLNGVSGLIKIGLWAIRRWKKIYSLEQLSMEEKGDPRKTFLYELSQQGHLRYFRKIILLSSFQDSYVSWHSARISSHRSKNSLSKVQQEMQSNILENNIYGASIHRLDINFNVRTNDLDSFIGRTAHINLIIKQPFFKTLGITLPNLFNLTEFGKEGMFL